jgi:hypothetical protein
MKLFIANATKHIQQFAYRIPEFPRVFQNEIRPGEQIVVYQDSDRATLEHIVKQHQECPKPFLIPVEELDKHKGFAGLIFSFDKPVPAFKIEETFSRNDEALEALGQEQRKEAAAALSATMEQSAQEVGATVSGVKMTVQEEGRKDDTNGTSKVNETIEVQGKGGKGGKK